MLAVCIDVPVHSDNSSADLPVKQRLDAYASGILPYRRSAQEKIQAEAQAAEARADKIASIQSRARQHGEHVRAVVRQRLEVEMQRCGSLADKIMILGDSARRRRASFEEEKRQQRRVRELLHRELRGRLETRRASRGAAEKRRCDEAARQHKRLLAARIEKAREFDPTSPPREQEGAGRGQPPPRADGADSREAVEPGAALLLAEMSAHKAEKNFEALSLWMSSPATTNLMEECLRHAGADPGAAPPEPKPAAAARLALAIFAMCADADACFDADSAPDQRMRREAFRFAKKLKAALTQQAAAAAAGPPPEQGPGPWLGQPRPASDRAAFAASLTRVSRFHAAWSALDKPATLDFLLSSVVSLKARQAQGALTAARAEEQANELFAQCRSIGGPEAEAEARERFGGTWRPVAQADLATQVMETANRAFWDLVREATAKGEYESLFSVLGEMQQAMKALVSHSATQVAELDDKFDATWLAQQAAAGALTFESVQALVRFVVESISGWQAPVDGPATSEWAGSVEAALGARDWARLPLDDFIQAHMVEIVRGAIVRVGAVYTRMMAIAQEREAELAAERAEAAEAVENSEMARQD